MKGNSRHDVWIIAAGYLAAIHVGKLAPIIPILQKQLHISLIQAGFALSLVQCAGMLFALFLGVFSEKFGLKKCFTLGLVILGLSSITGVYIINIYSLFILRFSEGIGFLLVTLTAPAILKRICDPKVLNVKMGIWGSYMGLGVGLAILSIPLLLQYMSWQSIWMFLGVGCLILASIIVRYLKLPMVQQNTVNGDSFAYLLKITLFHPPIILLAIIFACYTGQWLTVIGFLPSVYLSHHIDLRIAGVLTAFVSISNIVGTLMSGWLLHHGFAPKTLLKTGFFIMLLMGWVTFVVAEAVPFPLQYLSVVIFSAIGGFIPTTVFAISLYYAPKTNAIAASVGLVLQISAFTQFFIPPLSAKLVSYTHDWNSIVFVTSTLALIGIIAVWKLFKCYPLKY